MTNIVEPSVKLLAYTIIDELVIQEDMEIQENSTPSETLITYAGRECYDSFHRPNPATHDDKDYLERTLFQEQHGSIMEHSSATLRIRGVSRAFLTELTRHRHLSFSVRSQRFVNENSANIVVPPALRGVFENEGESETLDRVVENFNRVGVSTFAMYDILALFLVERGYSRKQAREAARAILPSMTETRMVVSGNLRAWKQTIDRRTAPDADAEMIEVMNMAKRELHRVSPVIFPLTED